MEVILLKDVPRLGDVGDLVKVKPGFARNFLLPKNYALAASVKNKSQLSHQQKIADFAKKKAAEAAKTLAQKVEGTSVVILKKIGEQGKLYGSVSTMDIAKALKEQGLEIERRKIQLGEPIKQLGNYKVNVRLHEDIFVNINVAVNPENPEALLANKENESTETEEVALEATESGTEDLSGSETVETTETIIEESSEA